MDAALYACFKASAELVDAAGLQIWFWGRQKTTVIGERAGWGCQRTGDRGRINNSPY
jgi:hypothetical protein